MEREAGVGEKAGGEEGNVSCIGGVLATDRAHEPVEEMVVYAIRRVSRQYRQEAGR